MLCILYKFYLFNYNVTNATAVYITRTVILTLGYVPHVEVERPTIDNTDKRVLGLPYNVHG